MKFASVLLAVSCWLSAAFAMQPGIDAREVVRQVRSLTRSASGVEQSLDNGEFLIDTSGVHAEYDPAVASDGTNYLVVWQDYRNNRDTSDIYGARVSQAGTVIDPTGIAISTAAYGQESPAVAFDGANFLVVWKDYRNNPDTSDIYGARVSLAGVVLDPDGVAISTAAYHQVSPAVSFDGTNWLVVWTDGRSGPDEYDIYGARVSQAGIVLDPTGIAISTAASYQFAPAVSFDGTNWLVVWTDGRSGPDEYDIYGARVNYVGEVLDSTGIAISTAAYGQWVPTVSFDGTNWLVVWTDERSGYYDDIYGARVTPAGSVLDPNGIPISTAADWRFFPVVSFDGTNWLVVWEDLRSYPDINIYGVRVTPAGVVFDSGPVVRQEGSQWYPALARGTGSQMFLVYQGWAGTVGGKTYDADRIWGKFGPLVGVQETPNAEVRTPNSGPTIVRGVLFLPRLLLTPNCSLLSTDGRKVLDLHPGANDVSWLSPGVYFVGEGLGTRGQGSGRMRKVVIQH